MRLHTIAEAYDLELEDLQYRSDGRIEWVCEHGIGHTVYSPGKNYIHGCDGCCERFSKRRV